MKRREALLWGLYLIVAGFLAWFVALLPRSGRDAALEAAVAQVKWKWSK